MKNLNDTLPELMRRATENLEPESSDLVERGMARGVTLRRRRTALVSFSGAAAVLATAGIIVSGSQLFAKDAEPPAAGTTTKQSATDTTNTAAKPVTKEETQATLIKLLPPRLKVAKAQVWDDGMGYQAELVLNDGQGLSVVSLAVRPAMKDPGCSNQKPGTCVTRPDGSRLTVVKNELEKRSAGVVYHHVYLVRPGSESIGLSSFNGTSVTRKGAVTIEKTRANPALTAAELTAIADSELWRFPAKPVESTAPDKPQPPITIGGKGPKRTLRAVARWAQHWNVIVAGPEEWKPLKDILVAHCETFARDVSEITCSVNVRIDPDQPLSQAIDTAITNAAAYEEAGVDLVVLNLPLDAPPSVLEPLAKALA